MDNNIILQSLKESFEVLKDSWENRSGAIVNCIVETEPYDGELAMEMWIYVLQRILEANNSIIPEKYIEPFIHNVFAKFENKYPNEKNSLGNPFSFAIIFSHIVKYRNQLLQLINIILGKAHNAGYYANFTTYNSIKFFIGCLLVQQDKIITKTVIESLGNNINLTDKTVGTILQDSNDCVRDGFWNDNPNEKEYLLSCVDYIKDKENKAEVLVTILSFN